MYLYLLVFLYNINFLRTNRFDKLRLDSLLQLFFIGYSDHTKPDKKMMTVKTAFLIGAKVIEKHFTHNKKLRGNDHYHSMNFKDLKKLRNDLKDIIPLLGKDKKSPVRVEMISRKYARRSLIAKNDLRIGHKIKKNDLLIKRPGTGIEPEFLNKLISRTLKKNIKADQILKWSHFK